MPRKKTKKEETTEPKSLQPEINIGLVGHVDHGKTTLVQALSGKWTDTHSEEIKRGITIRLGYADVAFYKCTKCTGTDAYGAREKCTKCGTETQLLRKVSLVDAPGHESLMATMLCGANIIDGALLMVSATETCPQPQTREHLQALEIVGVENLVVIQNKIDLVKEEQAKKNYQEIKEFLKGTKFEDAPIIPMSAIHSINLDILIETIQEKFQTPERDLKADPIMFVARSFDINKPGTKPDKMTGGILGGSLKQGKLIQGADIEILPGYEVQEKNQKVWKPLKTTITSIMAGGEKTKEAIPGGSIAIMTELDPSVVKSDKLVGSLVVLEGTAPKVWNEFKLETHLLERVVGAKDKLVVEPVKLGELLMLNVNAAATVGVVKELGKNQIKCTLRKPICAETGARVAMGRNLGQRWRLIGYGIIKD
ncbi:translation initiation factor IF-2 subunit gamma [Candidatus Woesearchaeota archaeon]|nr:translation initiation factor IF-2 subunit gamma [Candidatus Woesearchaeota archaeon]MBW3016096.1 translation initiation factor IF-2 subunit gamma [Candidatus Woesearchaeota archaeon]